MSEPERWTLTGLGCCPHTKVQQGYPEVQLYAASGLCSYTTARAQAEGCRALARHNFLARGRRGWAPAMRLLCCGTSRTLTGCMSFRHRARHGLGDDELADLDRSCPRRASTIQRTRLP